MKQMALRATILLVIIILLISGTGFFLTEYTVKADIWTKFPANAHLYNNGVMIAEGDICDRNGTVLSTTQNNKRVYNENRTIRIATVHAVGDLYGNITTGVQSEFWKQLTGYDTVGGVFTPSGKGNSMYMTLDSSLCSVALNAIGNRRGTVGVYNYKTGEVLCMVSTPAFDVNEKVDLSDEYYEGAYLNRLISSSYAPGSTFKIITAAAAIETFDDAQTRTYHCDEGVYLNGEWISCTGDHGDISIDDALTVSCNAYFSQLAVDLGADKLTEYAKKCGYMTQFSLNGIKAKKSTIDLKNTNEADLGWAGIGQYTDLCNPLQQLILMGTIASDGECTLPYLVEDVITPSRLSVKSRIPSSDGKISLLPETAKTLKKFMRSDVTDNYGDSSFPGLTVCAKTGTAEVSKEKEPHSWFVGFTTDEDCPLAFVVIAENSGAGIGAAKSIASSVLSEAKNIYR